MRGFCGLLLLVSWDGPLGRSVPAVLAFERRRITAGDQVSQQSVQLDD